MEAQTITWYGEILKQLGGRQFIAMTGAKNFYYSEAEKYIAMKIMRNAKRVTHLKIYLSVMDTYTMEFLNCGKQIITLSKVDTVYCEDMRSTFERNTGLYTRL